MFFCFDFNQFCLQLFIASDGLSNIVSKIFSRFAPFKKDKSVDIPAEIIEQEGLYTNLLQQQSLEAGLKYLKLNLESKAMVGTTIFEDYFAHKKSTDRKRENNPNNNNNRDTRGKTINSFYADLISQS